jgi:HEAT repeat protein
MARDEIERDKQERYRRILEARDRGDKDYLISSLLDPDHRLRAAQIVEELKIREASGQLIRLLDAADPVVRIASARALGQLGAVEALPRLREMAMEDESDGVRSWAVGALGEIGDPQDVEFLVRLLSDSSLRVRGAAALALGRLGDPKALEPLRAERRRVRHSPLEWYWHRRIYNSAIKALTKRRTSAS